VVVVGLLFGKNKKKSKRVNEPKNIIIVIFYIAVILRMQYTSLLRQGDEISSNRDLYI